jgi:arsenate reductase-like glutaredoxin family protein
MTTPIEQIEKATRDFAKARETLSGIVSDMTTAIETIKRSNIKRLKKAVAEAADTESVLRGLVDRHPECFERPRTRTLNGIKCGYQKAKGKIDYTDAERVIVLIRKHFPEQADVLISTKESPVKEALAGLAAADLKRLGVTVVEAGDQIVIKAADSEVDKMVDALLKGATEEAEG